MFDARPLSRRSFLGTALSLAGCAVPLLAADSAAWLNDLAVNAFGLRAHLIADFAGTLQRLRAIGYRRLELVSFSGWDGDPYGSFTALAAMSGEAVAATLSAAGLRATSAHVRPRELGPDTLEKTVQWMAPIGISTLVVAGLPNPTEGVDAMLRSIDGLNETGHRVASHGLRLILHGDFALWQPYGRARLFDEFVRRVDLALCKLQLDLGAALQMSVNAVDVLLHYGRYVDSVHLRDGMPPFDPAVYVPSVPLGTGVAPIPEIVHAALNVGVSDFVVEMVMRPEGRELEALTSSYLYLHHLRSA